jgi:hypothetical protein
VQHRVQHPVQIDSFDDFCTVNAAGVAVARYHGDFFWSYRRQFRNGRPSSCDIARCWKFLACRLKLPSCKVSRDATSLPLAECGWILRWDWQVKLVSTSGWLELGLTYVSDVLHERVKPSLAVVKWCCTKNKRSDIAWFRNGIWKSEVRGGI